MQSSGMNERSLRERSPPARGNFKVSPLNPRFRVFIDLAFLSARDESGALALRTRICVHTHIESGALSAL